MDNMKVLKKEKTVPSLDTFSGLGVTTANFFKLQKIKGKIRFRDPTLERFSENMHKKF